MTQHILLVVSSFLLAVSQSSQALHRSNSKSMPWGNKELSKRWRLLDLIGQDNTFLDALVVDGAILANQVHFLFSWRTSAVFTSRLGAKMSLHEHFIYHFQIFLLQECCTISITSYIINIAAKHLSGRGRNEEAFNDWRSLSANFDRTASCVVDGGEIYFNIFYNILRDFSPRLDSDHEIVYVDLGWYVRSLVAPSNAYIPIIFKELRV